MTPWLNTDQARHLKYLQALRHGRPANWLAFRQLTHGLGLLAHRLEDVPAGRVCQCGKKIYASHG